ncbi:MAG: hypothetical protein NVSMB16_08230 [Acidimicrobiales bacterium]
MAGEPVDAAVRASLESERDELQAELADLGGGAISGDHYDAGFADSSQVTAERGEAEALAGRLQETLDDVNAALARLDAGTFGVCEGCGAPVGDARLEAIPAARQCMACASKR